MKPRIKHKSVTQSFINIKNKKQNISSDYIHYGAVKKTD